jgi:hypothetical protein
LKLWDDIMDKRIVQIVLGQRRPFGYEDFVNFRIDNRRLTIPYGTYRNKTSERKKKGTVVVAYKVGRNTYYTLDGVDFPKPKRITDCRMVGPTCHPIFKELNSLRMGPPSLHNIRLRFQHPGIWHRFRKMGYPIIPSNCDIKIQNEYPSLDITVGIHRSDTVSVSLGCSEMPVATDIYGVIRLSNALNVIRERISDIGNYKNEHGISGLPSCYEWIVTMWHVGVDSVTEYTGEKFQCTWQLAEGILVRLYSKDFGRKKTLVRFERQEYPKKEFADLISKFLYPSGVLI